MTHTHNTLPTNVYCMPATTSNYTTSNAEWFVQHEPYTGFSRISWTLSERELAHVSTNNLLGCTCWKSKAPFPYTFLKFLCPKALAYISCIYCISCICVVLLTAPFYWSYEPPTSKINLILILKIGCCYTLATVTVTKNTGYCYFRSLKEPGGSISKDIIMGWKLCAWTNAKHVHRTNPETVIGNCAPFSTPPPPGYISSTTQWPNGDGGRGQCVPKITVLSALFMMVTNDVVQNNEK